MAHFGLFLFGCVVVLGGTVLVLLRRYLGRYANRYWSAAGSKRAKTERYWTHYSMATGLVISALGLVLVLIGALR